MAESALQLSFQELRNEASWALGYGRDPGTEASSNLSAEAEFDVKAAVDRGYATYLFPPSVGDAPPHTWSWLRAGSGVAEAEATLTLLNNVHIYDAAQPVGSQVPDDFGGGVREFVFPSGNSEDRILVISWERIQQMRAHEAVASVFAHVQSVVRPGKSCGQLYGEIKDQLDEPRHVVG